MFDLNLKCKLLVLFSAGVVLSACAPTNTDTPSSSTSSSPATQVKPTIQLKPDQIPEMVSIPAGTFVMGDQTLSGDKDERPAHQVNLQAFAIAKYEITFHQYAAFVQDTNRTMPDDAGWGKANRPVINVSWNDADAYVKWLAKKTGRKFQLASEAQWEYAARAGAITLYSNGNKANKVCQIANIADQAAKKAGRNWQITQCNDNAVYSSEVGKYRPNEFGLHDMQGNVWEWVQDCYRSDYHAAAADGSPAGPSSCVNKVIRGGSFQQSAEHARLSNREKLSREQKIRNVGFRVSEK